MKHDLPMTMRALELQNYEGWRTGLRLVERPVPRPKTGQVLVKIEASPVNPADLAFVSGYGLYTLAALMMLDQIWQQVS